RTPWAASTGPSRSRGTPTSRRRCAGRGWTSARRSEAARAADSSFLRRGSPYNGPTIAPVPEPLMVAKYIVRHGSMRFLGEYEPGEGDSYARADEVVVRSERGLEVGQVLCPASPRALELLAEPTRGRILRRLTEEDRTALDRLCALEAEEMAGCQRFVTQRRWQMELVDVE